MANSSWEKVQLSELVEDTVGGLWGNPPDAREAGEADVLVVRGADFRQWNERRALDAAARRIPIRLLDRRVLRPGDLVLEVSGGGPTQPVGRVLVVDERATSQVHKPLICSNFCRRVRMKPGVDPLFVKHQLEWLYATGHTSRFQTASTNIRNLQVDEFLRGTTLVLPDLQVQRELAALWDLTDSKRDSSRNHIERAQRAIERFKQSVLSAAYTEAMGSEDSLVTLKELLREPLKNGYSARPVPHETRFRVLTLSATTSGWFDPTQFKYTDEVFESDSPFWLKPGDILIQRGNTAERVGVPAIYEGAPNEFLYPDLMIRARPREQVEPRFVWYMLLAPAARGYLRERATGSAGNMPKVNQGIVGNIPVPLPSQEARRNIVKRLDQAMEFAVRIQQRLEKIDRRVDRSAHAILGRAFRDELVPNGHSDEGT